jgi:hypothetical protein
MISTGEALRLLLAALGVGVMVPVMVQLFLTLRQIQRTIRQVDPSLRLLNQIAERQTEAPPASSQPAAPQLAAIIAALVPTVIAAYQAFRQQSASSEASTSAGQDSTWDISVSPRESREPES